MLKALYFLSLAMFVLRLTQATAQEEANPGRPTVSTPATLTPMGYLQFETGVLGAEHSGEFSRRLGFNEVVKFSPAKRLQLILQTEPLVRAEIGSQTQHNPGEVFAGLQAVMLSGEGKKPTLSVSYFRRAYASPAPEIDIGTNRQSALFLLSTDLGRFHVDSNAIITEQVEGAVHRGQFGQTLSVSHPLIRKLGISGELWHFTQPFLGSNAAGGLFALSLPIKPNLVLDGGFNRGLTSTSTRWEVFFGFTYLLPKKISRLLALGF